eukprot:11240685-Alexandrium_andersonii.AAC.1
MAPRALRRAFPRPRWHGPWPRLRARRRSPPRPASSEKPWFTIPPRPLAPLASAGPLPPAGLPPQEPRVPWPRFT